MLRSLQSLYKHVTCAVRINDVQSDIFDVKTGLKQGCILSPQLFKMFVNDLIHAINSLESGLCYGDGSNVSILLYADDIVLLSDNEIKMQSMLECLSEWCHTWGLQINFDKSKVMHFRASSKPKLEYQFKCGDSCLQLVTQYKYLGVLLTEHLDYTAMSKMVAQSASRALGLLISKDKASGGMPYTCYTKCYDATVQSIIDYSAALWETKSVTCINAVQNRAVDIFSVLGDMHQTWQLMETWDGQHQNTDIGCLLLGDGVV